MADSPQGPANDNIEQLRRQRDELDRQLLAAVEGVVDEATAEAQRIAEQHAAARDQTRAEEVANLQTQISNRQQTLTRIEGKRTTMLQALRTISLVIVSALGIGLLVFGGMALEKRGYTNFTGGPITNQQQAAASAPAVMADTVKTIVDASAATTGAKIDGVKTDLTARINTATDDLTTRVKAHREALEAALNANATAVESAKTELGDRTAALEIEMGKARTVLTGLTGKFESFERSRLAEAAPAPAPVAAAPAAAAPVATPAAPATGFVWPPKLNDRQILVYAKCAGQDWSGVDGETNGQLLTTYTAEQAAKFFSDSGDCAAYIAQATNVTKIKKQLEARSEDPAPEVTQAAVTTTPARTAPVARVGAAPQGVQQAQAPRKLANGMLCPALGSAKFLELNPRPRGDGWEMVEEVPNQPCGGWHRKNYNMAERQQPTRLRRQY